MTLKYKRILLKLSGESLMGEEKFGYGTSGVEQIVNEVLNLHKLGVEIAIVVGGGNIFRGKSLVAQGVDPSTADYMGMLATIQNGMFLKSILNNKMKNIYLEEKKTDPCAKKKECRLMTAIHVDELAEPFIYQRALKHMERNNIVIMAAGTGNPFFTTDTAAVLKAKELECDLVIKATKVDGVYDKDPSIPGAVLLETVSYMDAITNRLGVMDLTAFTMCHDHNIPIIVCDILGKDNLKKIALGEKIGTLVNE